MRKFNLKLIVAGEFYTNPKPYFELVQKLHLEKFVIMPNKFISNSDVVNYFCAADLIVQPYKEATQSGVTQIAYHFEKPMIVTDVGGLAEIIPNDKVGYVVPPKVEEISKAIQKFMCLPEEHFLENIQLEKQKYSWDRMLKTVQDLVNTLENDN